MCERLNNRVEFVIEDAQFCEGVVVVLVCNSCVCGDRDERWASNALNEWEI